jgi:hypothetical protein
MSVRGAYDDNGGMIVGECRPGQIEEIVNAIIELGEGSSPREFLAAMSIATGTLINYGFSSSMHDGVIAAHIDTVREFASK